MLITDNNGSSYFSTFMIITEVIGTFNDEDIYMFNAEHSDGAEYIHKYSGHRNNATGTMHMYE